MVTLHYRHTFISLALGVLLLSGCDALLAGGSPQKNTPFTATSTEMNNDEQAVKAAIEARIPDFKVSTVKKMNYGDLYEVSLQSGELIYTNLKAEYTLIGQLFDNTSKINLTQARAGDMPKIHFGDLPLSQAFSQVKGDGRAQIAVFEDPHCGYCKVFRQTLTHIDNVTVHTFVIDILGPESTQIARQVLCSEQPAQAWDNWMLHQQLPSPTKKCETNALKNNKALAQKLGVTGTPTVFFSHGLGVSGAMSREQLEYMLRDSVNQPAP